MQGDLSALIERANYISVDDAFEIAQTLKAGTFQYGDAQGGATHRFANLVIERHERIRAAAPEMLEALLAVSKIVTEGALVGFRWDDGDWAERLFKSQRETSSALRKALGDEIYACLRALSARDQQDGGGE